MPRFEFGGHGDPIPLPEDGLEAGGADGTNRLPLIYNLPDGTIFRQADYSTFGYTHYEVCVIGAAGGAGGAASPATSNVSARGGSGGGGGGGGLHLVSGRLDELPDEVLVGVGKSGGKGINSNGQPWYRPVTWTTPDHDFVGEYLAIFWEDVLPNRLPYAQAGAPKAPYVRLGPYPNGSYSPYVYLPMFERLPQHTEVRVSGQHVDYFIQTTFDTDGEDGEASTFGEIAMASGGKGGKKAPQYMETQTKPGYIGPGGNGGDGGIGGSIVAGGGGVGANSHLAGMNLGSNLPLYNLVEAENGAWDGHIGEGGGGGRGSSTQPDAAYGAHLGGGAYTQTNYFQSIDERASNGGRGSFSFADTSRYGPGAEGGSVGGGGGGATTQRRVPGSIFGGAWTEGPFSSLEGKIPGQSSEGVVVIKLIQID